MLVKSIQCLNLLSLPLWPDSFFFKAVKWFNLIWELMRFTEFHTSLCFVYTYTHIYICTCTHTHILAVVAYPIYFTCVFLLQLIRALTFPEKNTVFVPNFGGSLLKQRYHFFLVGTENLMDMDLKPTPGFVSVSKKHSTTTVIVRCPRSTKVPSREDSPGAQAWRTCRPGWDLLIFFLRQEIVGLGGGWLFVEPCSIQTQKWGGWLSQLDFLLVA